MQQNFPLWSNEKIKDTFIQWVHPIVVKFLPITCFKATSNLFVKYLSRSPGILYCVICSWTCTVYTCRWSSESCMDIFEIDKCVYLYGKDYCLHSNWWKILKFLLILHIQKKCISCFPYYCLKHPEKAYLIRVVFILVHDLRVQSVTVREWWWLVAGAGGSWTPCSRSQEVENDRLSQLAPLTLSVKP